MRRLRVLVMLLGLALLAGCASLLTRDLPLLHITPAALGAPRTVQQQLQLAYPGGGAVMESVLQLDAQHLQVINSAMGLRMATLDYDGQNLQADILPAMKVPPQRIVNDMLLVYAPQAALQAALPAGWLVRDEQHKRTVWRDTEVMIDISYDGDDHWQGRAVLHHHQLGYALTIDSSDIE